MSVCIALLPEAGGASANRGSAGLGLRVERLWTRDRAATVEGIESRLPSGCQAALHQSLSRLLFPARPRSGVPE